MWYINYKTNEGVLTMRKELLKGLTEEQIKKVESCKSSEEILNLAKAEGIELSDEQLEAVSGGFCGGGGEKISKDCPKCNSGWTNCIEQYEKDGEKWYKCRCRSCGHTYKVKGK